MPRKRLSRSQEYVRNSIKKPVDSAAVKVRQQKRQEELAKRKAKVKSLPKASVRQKSKHLRRKTVYVLVILMIIAAVALQAVNIISLNKERKNLETDQQNLKKEQARLQEELNNVNSWEYVEQQARQQLKLIMPGEILYVFPEITKSAIESGTEESGSGSERESN